MMYGIPVAKNVALYFRVEKERATTIIQEVQSPVKNWKALAKKLSIASREVNLMQGAFKVADNN